MSGENIVKGTENMSPGKKEKSYSEPRIICRKHITELCLS